MIANPSKHQGMILGKTDHQFNFSVNDSVELFGVTINKDLTFKQHVSFICKKVNNQFSVMTRFGKLMSTARVKNVVRMRAFPASGANLHVPPPIKIIRDTKTN